MEAFPGPLPRMETRKPIPVPAPGFGHPYSSQAPLFPFIVVDILSQLGHQRSSPSPKSNFFLFFNLKYALSYHKRKELGNNHSQNLINKNFTLKYFFYYCKFLILIICQIFQKYHLYNNQITYFPIHIKII